MNKLTITIPCYNQLELNKRCLRLLLRQTFRDFSIILIDDNGSQNYQEISNLFPDLNITYLRNDKNLGAMQNMFYAIKYPVNTDYVFCLHEDDVLASPTYLEEAIKILDNNSDISFVSGKPIWFLTEPPKEYSYLDKGYYIGNKNGFVDKIMEREKIIFDSIIYRAEVVKNTEPDLEKFATLCDRPFLLSLLSDTKKFCLFNFPIIFVRDHGVSDKRGDGTNYKHVFNLYSEYKKYTSNQIKFLTLSTNDILFNYIGRKTPTFAEYINEAKKASLFEYRKIRFFGLVSLFFIITGKDFYYKIKYLFTK